MIGVPGQPRPLFVNVGVTVYTTFSVMVPVFVSVWLIVAPLPFDPPVMLVGAAIVQANVVPFMLLDRFVWKVLPEHKMPLAGFAVTFGMGLTVIVYVCAVPGQLVPPDVVAFTV